MDVDIAEIEDVVRRLPTAERVRLIEVIARSLRVVRRLRSERP